jgi:DNA-damage-inducible protein D
MAQDLEVFHFEEDRPSFEAYARENGFRHWLASELMVLLSYSSMAPIRNAINRAMSACAQLNISIQENFQETRTETGARDWKLSRFACYLTVMNGDPKKHQVAAAQAYFVTMAEAFRQFVQQAEDVERVVIRGEVSDREKAISGTVNTRGIVNFAFFQNAGYRGMYNLNLAQIRRKKGVPTGRSPLDFMGKTELAANLFRITQTDEKIRNEDIIGQRSLECAAEHVGKTVRSTMIEISGTPPEQLPSARDIAQVRGNLKRTGREYAKLDESRVR